MSIQMKKPGTNISDPKVRSGAQRVATAKNNRFRKIVESTAPLFAGEILNSYEPVTAEKVIERRIECQANYQLWKKGFNAMQREHIRSFRAETRDLAGSDREFRFLMRLVVRMKGGDRSSRWSRALALVKRRRERVLSVKADLVLAWLQNEAAPVTHLDLWEKRGDGMTAMEILQALTELMEFAYAGMVDLVKLPERFRSSPDWTIGTAWTWEACNED